MAHDIRDYNHWFRYCYTLQFSPVTATVIFRCHTSVLDPKTGPQALPTLLWGMLLSDCKRTNRLRFRRFCTDRRQTPHTHRCQHYPQSHRDGFSSCHPHWLYSSTSGGGNSSSGRAAAAGRGSEGGRHLATRNELPLFSGPTATRCCSCYFHQRLSDSDTV